MKLTPWFPGTVKPVRSGVYQRKYSSGKFLYCYWNGHHFECAARTIEDSLNGFMGTSMTQNLPWRGVAK